MKIYHWIYIILVLAISALYLVMLALGITDNTSNSLLPLIVSTILVGATYGKVTNRALLFRWFWVSFFWLMSLTTLFLFGLGIYLLWQLGITASVQVTVILLGISVIAPGLITLFQYSFRSSQIWQSHLEI